MVELIVVGTSWGGLTAVSRLLEALPDEVDPPIVIAQHRSSEPPRGQLEDLLQRHARRPVVEAGDKQALEPRTVYIAPADYHLLVEPGSLHLSTDQRVSFSRPSIDVLFESAADAYGPRLLAVVLTGANDDGADGVARVVDRGGRVLVQDPDTAERRAMPDAAIAAAAATVLPIERIPRALAELCGVGEAA